MSNKKLTTEEKIEKSKGYVDELTRLRERIKTVQSAKKKLDAEIDDELEKAYIVNMQELGKHTAGKIGEGSALKNTSRSLIAYLRLMRSRTTLSPKERSRVGKLMMRGLLKLSLRKKLLILTQAAFQRK